MTSTGCRISRSSRRRQRARLAIPLLCGTALACSPSGPSGQPDASAAAAQALPPPTFVGRQVCANCHAEEERAWEGSHHDLAMQPATASTVAGDFDGATFTYGGVTSSFFRGPGPDNDFRVRTDGPDGKLHDYRITHTFGIEPLQQYLVELPGGRLQALGICWDTRPRESGGQRWFHLYPTGAVDHRSFLHWTSPLQNWNSSCAECHSTNLQKNYRGAEVGYQTTWSEIDVSCEACHGPGSRHVDGLQQATLADGDRPHSSANSGFEVGLGRKSSAAWTFEANAPTARRTPPPESRAQVEACGRCHARSERIVTDYVYGRPLEDTHRLALLDAGLYHADGQILDEAYEYGSFVQSAMYHAGVTCTDCHDPHSARLRLEGNATCSPCHRPDVFDTAAHHFHPEGSASASCVGCHMPSRDYMVVDPRHDHGFRVPRPDLSAALGVPNACSACHRERDAGWAARAVAAWYPNGRSGRPHPAEALHAGRTWQADAGPRLAALIHDAAAPAILRATALSLLRRYPGTIDSSLTEGAVRDPDPRVRRSAAELLAAIDPADRERLGRSLLNDPVRSVRLAAARALAGDAAGGPGAARHATLQAGLAEYRMAQEIHADRAEGQMNLAWLDLIDGNPGGAEQAYRTALRMMPDFSPAAINLADLYRAQGQDPEGERILRAALARTPDDADLHHALGLLLARQQRYDAAIDALKRATELGRDTPRHAYVLGIALNSSSRTSEALKTLERAHARYPADTDTLLALATINRDSGDTSAAARWTRLLLAVNPGHAGARQILAQVDGPNTP